ncbi:FeoC-like transcriptional regulator [Prosthecochloris vibrioformis]|uniref:Transcriptional regulator HTH-type FeoC domain-containing protein n=1 Tax=Prosthecochloris vibrioformis TaxID=1098 RepID=A0A5C4S269_PROVB|nr:FeoC-like transcriptional regulator [Prosthecochloris vibrioformis]TNJ37237.1 hypothetical protein FGF68_03165 [Prosthecochloris vibrioformis]
MTLSDIKQHLSANGPATMSGLCTTFKTTKDTIEPLLEQWIRKGRITQLQQEEHTCNSAGSCSCCNDHKEMKTWYAWRGNA